MSETAERDRDHMEQQAIHLRKFAISIIASLPENKQDVHGVLNAGTAGSKGERQATEMKERVARPYHRTTRSVCQLLNRA